jgi:hypothetical protein
VAQGLKNHVFTGMLAQHVASELRMRFCSHRLQTHPNTPSRFKIDFLFFKYNGFFGYNGFITDFFFFTGFRHFRGRKKLGCHHN